jgi:soluble lytic murein transglycosylase-like protein
MIKIQNVAVAAMVSFGLILLGGCQTTQTSSSTHSDALSVKHHKKSRKPVSRKSVKSKSKSLRVDEGRYAGSASNYKKPSLSKKSRRKQSLRKSKGKQASRSKRKGQSRASRRGGSYDGLIRHHARANGVPYALARAVVQVESGFRASARGGVGEIGLMQLRKSTARGMGYRGSSRALYHPETNIKYGMRYLGQAYKLGGRSTCGAILKYNAGHAARSMNPISRRYCRKVSRIMRGSV